MSRRLLWILSLAALVAGTVALPSAQGAAVVSSINIKVTVSATP